MNMKKHFLLGAAVLTLSTAVASAQTLPKTTPENPAASSKGDAAEPKAERSPSATQPSADSKGEAAKSQAGSPDTKSSTTGQAQGETKTQQKQDSAQSRPEPGDAAKGQTPDQKGQTTGQSPSTRSTTGQRAPSQPSGSSTTQSAPSTGQSGQQAQQPSTQQPSGSAAQTPSTGTTSQQTQAGQSSTGTVSLTTEQQTRIQQNVLASSNAPRVDRVDFSLSVGTAVPSHVRIVDVPPTLVEIHPEWRGHDYFIVRDEIVIVDRSRKVVAVVPVGGSRAQARGSSTTVSYTPDQIRRIQLVLIERGVLRGEADGVLGPQTREALITFQRQQGFETTGEITPQVITGLGLTAQFEQSGSSTTTGAAPSPSGQPDSSGQTTGSSPPAASPTQQPSSPSMQPGDQPSSGSSSQPSQSSPPTPQARPQGGSGGSSN